MNAEEEARSLLSLLQDLQNSQRPSISPREYVKKEEFSTMQRDSSEVLKGKIAALAGENRTLKDRIAELQSEKQYMTDKITAILNVRELKIELNERNQLLSRLRLVLSPVRQHPPVPSLTHSGFSPRHRSEVSTPKSPLWAEVRSALDKDLSPRSPAVQHKIEVVRQHVGRPLRSLSQTSLRSTSSKHRYEELLEKQHTLAVISERRK